MCWFSENSLFTDKHFIATQNVRPKPPLKWKWVLFLFEPRQLVAFGNFPAFLITFIIDTCRRKNIAEDARKETAEKSEENDHGLFLNFGSFERSRFAHIFGENLLWILEIFRPEKISVGVTVGREISWRNRLAEKAPEREEYFLQWRTNSGRKKKLQSDEILSQIGKLVRDNWD